MDTVETIESKFAMQCQEIEDKEKLFDLSYLYIELKGVPIIGGGYLATEAFDLRENNTPLPEPELMG
ncbi:hypothetical protein [Vibrio mexicanus]|uniref:hypothetical protein n=1 Tax=Vibrio mexicanus TaxID=1004326 RepID=UPI00069A4224|nr:hypothetical protein [Vibrio mexicanus]